MSQASEAKLNLRNQERRLLESYLMSGYRPWSEIKRDNNIGRGIAEAVRRVSNREAFKFVNIDWTALGAALVEEWPFSYVGVIGCDGQHEKSSTLGCEDPEHCEVALERETF